MSAYYRKKVTSFPISIICATAVILHLNFFYCTKVIVLKIKPANFLQSPAHPVQSAVLKNVFLKQSHFHVNKCVICEWEGLWSTAKPVCCRYKTAEKLNIWAIHPSYIGELKMWCETLNTGMWGATGEQHLLKTFKEFCTLNNLFGKNCGKLKWRENDLSIYINGKSWWIQSIKLLCVHPSREK